ncbi:MAG TPA: HEAT repeat domain-containing protein [Pirellulales bacterium]|nr:HEAT repeat domain-containing protein [Pirellulales bacterium]
MSISVVCQCGKKFQAKDEHAGAKTKCPVCGQPLTIPRPGGGKPSPASSTARAPDAPQRPLASTPAPVAAPPAYEGKRIADWLDLLQVDDPAARKHATEVLATIGPEAGTELPVFIERLEAEHVLMRHWAVSCLERIGPAARPAIDALVKRLDDEEPLIRERSAAALERIEPACAAFAARLRRGLSDKNSAKRVSAVATFRREMKTLGISRCRFWACSCGSVFEKDDLEERLRLLADGEEIEWEGTRGCKKCGQSHALRDVYAGKHDVPRKFWPQLIKRFGDRVQVPDDLLADASQEPQSYEISDSQMMDVLALGLSAMPSTMPVIPASLDLSDDAGYALAEPAPAHATPPHLETDDADQEMVPGAIVRKSGNYKCTACHKMRMSQSKSALKLGPAVQTKTVMKHFKAGRAFSECPHCGDLTEWQFVE